MINYIFYEKNSLEWQFVSNLFLCSLCLELLREFLLFDISIKLEYVLKLINQTKMGFDNYNHMGEYEVFQKFHYCFARCGLLSQNNCSFDYLEIMWKFEIWIIFVDKSVLYKMWEALLILKKIDFSIVDFHGRKKPTVQPSFPLTFYQ